MANFVLVHGAWHGAWCWSRVLPLLRKAGHAAHAVTLTGVGERAHLLSREITLETHIADVATHCSFYPIVCSRALTLCVHCQGLLLV